MIQVALCFSPRSRQVEQHLLSAPPDVSIGDAIDGWLSDGDALPGALRSALASARSEEWSMSLWGRKVSLSERLGPGDRLELSRPLLVDPKTARRERFKKRGSKSAGLFSKRRPGAKPGY